MNPLKPLMLKKVWEVLTVDYWIDFSVMFSAQLPFVLIKLSENTIETYVYFSRTDVPSLRM